MNTITKLLLLLILPLVFNSIQAQDSIPDSNRYKISKLKDLKEEIKKEERENLKFEVENINKRLEQSNISQEEAEVLKKEAAKKRALNIENRLAIVDNKIDLLSRNEEGYNEDDSESIFKVTIDKDGSTLSRFKFRSRNKPRKYDRRTYSDLVFAFGFNNAIIEGENLDDSPYKFGGSRFFELGWAWKTRVFKESNFLRFKYGVSLQVNGLKPTDNRYFVSDGNTTTLEEFPLDLRKSKLSISNLVLPVHFEIGPSRKIERKKYFRYTTRRQFKLGFGGYVGFNIGTRQKLKYTLDGDKTKDKFKRNYNTSNLVYGLSGYVAIGGVALYAKYDLNPIFKDQVVDQNNISLGVRFDMD